MTIVHADQVNVILPLGALTMHFRSRFFEAVQKFDLWEVGVALLDDCGRITGQPEVMPLGWRIAPDKLSAFNQPKVS